MFYRADVLIAWDADDNIGPLQFVNGFQRLGWKKLLAHGVLRRLCQLPVRCYSVQKEIEEIGNGGQHAVPVGNERQPQGILQEVLRGLAQALGEGSHRHLLGVPVECQPI